MVLRGENELASFVKTINNGHEDVDFSELGQGKLFVLISSQGASRRAEVMNWIVKVDGSHVMKVRFAEVMCQSVTDGV
jgi:tRNA U54 and U55 pseudouridine synthase Pus10